MKTPYDYDELLQAAGVEVIAYQSFGSYQGDWIAKINYNGKTGWIKDYYGSCSGCDALQAEFNYATEVTEESVKQFANQYLQEIKTFEEVLAEASKNTSWDMEADEMVKWLKNNQ